MEQGKKKENIQIRIRNESRDITTEKIWDVREWYEQLYAKNYTI